MSEQADKKSPIPGFRLLNKLGQGGMGSVFRAVQESLDREVALKIMPLREGDNNSFKERFFLEARTAGKLNHPNIVQGIDTGEAGRYCWIAMELVKGEDAGVRLSREGKLSEVEAHGIITQMAEALEHASESGLVHRDVKPENILLTEDGTAKLCDLGIAKAPSEDAGLTQDGKALGTPRYISPEQARGEHDIDTRSDIYSLGASWFHLLAGEAPFDGPTPAVIMMKHCSEKLPSLADLTPGLNPYTIKVIEKMMAKERERRYQDLEELKEDLQCLADSKVPVSLCPGAKAARKKKKKKTVKAASVAPPLSKKGKTRKREGRRPAEKKAENYWPLIIGGGVVIVIVLVLVLRGGEEEPVRSAAPVKRISAPPLRKSTGVKKKGSPSSSKQESIALRAWNAMIRGNHGKDDLLVLKNYREFSKAYAGTSYGKRAGDKAAALKKNYDEVNREAAIEAARAEWEDIKSGRYRADLKALCAAYTELARSFPDTKYGKMAKHRAISLKESIALEAAEAAKSK